VLLAGIAISGLSWANAARRPLFPMTALSRAARTRFSVSERCFSLQALLARTRSGHGIGFLPPTEIFCDFKDRGLNARLISGLILGRLIACPMLSLSRRIRRILRMAIEASGAVPNLGGGIPSVAGDHLSALPLCVLVVSTFEDLGARDVVLGRD
jgi:hypothetical protein